MLHSIHWLPPPTRSRPVQTTTQAYATDLVRTVTEALQVSGLHRALQMLNETVPYRFTGVYHFEPGWVRSLVLFDRENPALEVGADVPMKESYCMYTAREGSGLRIVNAIGEARWAGHAARESVLSYVAVLLLDGEGAALGTLCHFDFCSRKVPPGTLELLEAVRRPVEKHMLAHGLTAPPPDVFG
jgi:hypothetical protein